MNQSPTKKLKMDSADYIVQLNKPFKNTIEMMNLRKNFIYIMTDVRHLRTTYGDRYIATFDEDFEVFMPKRFSKDWEDEKLRDQLIFFVRTADDGIWGTKPYANYVFVLPRVNGCICHIPFLWSKDETATIAGTSTDGEPIPITYPECVCKELCDKNEKKEKEPVCPCLMGDKRGALKISNYELYYNTIMD